MAIAHSDFFLVEAFRSITVQVYAVVDDGHTALSFRAVMFLFEMK